MNTVVWDSIGSRLRNYFQESRARPYILAPFIRPDTLIEMLGTTATRATIVTSWREDHLIQGASTLDLYPFCKNRGWSLYINDALHAKCYTDAFSSAWIGSANITRTGFGFAAKPNLEVMCHLDPAPPALRLGIYQVLNRSRLVTDALYRAYASWSEDQELMTPPVPPPVELPTEVIDPFLISQLPASTSPQVFWRTLNAEDEELDFDSQLAAEHDLILYGVDPTLDYLSFARTLAPAFLNQPFITALKKFVSGRGQRFGAIKQWIQETCTTVPEPYRRDLTEPVQHIYAWLKELAPHEFEVTVPGRRSQILRHVGTAR